MLFEQKYGKSSGISHAGGQTTVDFAPDLGREPTFFQGQILEPVRYREAMCALRDVVVSDLNYKPKDHSAYQAWVQEQYIIDLAEVLEKRSEIGKQMKEVQEQLREVQARQARRKGDFYKAQRRYFDYLYQVDKAAWWVLDPVITVAPDQVFFEAFSLDESSYGRLAVHNELFDDVKEFQYGTTNIDFSDALYNEIQRIRSYRKTEFKIDPTGFEVAAEHREVYKEKKIDVPTSWIRGFLQVQSAMSLPTTSFDIQPIDLYNLCRFLRLNRERRSPRSLKFIFEPGQPVRVVIQPWDEVLVFQESIYEGKEKREIRTWGRRRILLLERLLPLTKKITVHLLGNGMPSFYVADLGSLSFTLGLSGWTRNDWAGAGNFDLLVGTAKDVSARESARVFAQLKKHKSLSVEQLAIFSNLSLSKVQAALRQLCSAGRVMFDLEVELYRLRELTRDPLPMEELAYTNPQEEKAEDLVTSKQVELIQVQAKPNGNTFLTGRGEHEKRPFTPEVTLDIDGRIVEASCNCYFYRQNRLMKGPCEHILATMSLHRQQSGGDRDV
ncbi:SWIM zinc finger [Seinonella peptonophila]|uniref:SWIM zinc finger n=1 Tax=Seinonella peptonophila TaxID=112248 RepID=A0A1M4YCZ1_9BACL|nr:SWIM zinc finger family protein [Seinonella peptonophila]SHF03615.1 SWIM zinc finger [Seinonella peptonophila]